MRLECGRLSPTADVPSHTFGAAMGQDRTNPGPHRRLKLGVGLASLSASRLHVAQITTKMLLSRLDGPMRGLCGMADIFISYTNSDREWAYWVGHRLESLGHTPRIHDWEISGGGDIAAWMEERHHAADQVLCIVSSAYLEKPYSAWERRAAQWAAATDRPNFVLPVFVESCKAPTLFAHLKRCDLHGISEEEASARLKAFLQPAAKPPRGIFPG